MFRMSPVCVSCRPCSLSCFHTMSPFPNHVNAMSPLSCRPLLPSRQVAKSPCRHVALSPCRPVAMSPCRPVAMSPCRHVHVAIHVALSNLSCLSPEPVMSPCRHVAMSPEPVMPPCRPITLVISPCRHVARVSSIPSLLCAIRRGEFNECGFIFPLCGGLPSGA